MSEYFEMILRGIEKEIEPLSEAVLSGSCQEFIEYRECLAKIKALELAGEVVKEYRTRYYSNEE